MRVRQVTMDETTSWASPVRSDSAEGTGFSMEHVSALLLRPWAESDAAGMREAIDEDVGHLKPWLSWSLAEPVSLERTRNRLREYVDQFQQGLAWRYAITPHDQTSLILGGAGLNVRVGPGAHDVGYWVRRSATRQGIAAAAVSALAVHAFSDRRIDRLVIQCDVANSASASFARAIGFLFRGSASATYPDGRLRPLLQFEMTRDRYRKVFASRIQERARRVRLLIDHPPS